MLDPLSPVRSRRPVPELSAPVRAERAARSPDEVVLSQPGQNVPPGQELDEVEVGNWDGFQAFLDQLTSTRVRSGCSTEVLIDGQNAFPKMLACIDGAQSSVNWTVYQFEKDSTGQDVAAHLAQAADRGCKVRLLLDGIGSPDLHSGPLRQFLEDHHVEVLERAKSKGHVTHRKILVVDGQTGFIGGMNVGDVYAAIWHDIHSRVTGPAVADLQQLFVTQWEGLGGSVGQEEQAGLFPPLPETGETPARILGHVGGQDTHLKKAYLRAIDTARESVTVADPYVTDNDVYRRLCAAASRGVDVRLILPKTNDVPATQVIERSHYKQLLAAGVKIYEYKGRPMAHDKVAVFDHRVATIGSSNLDAGSLITNDEANVWVDDRNVAGLLEAALVDDQTNSDFITAA